MKKIIKENIVFIIVILIITILYNVKLPYYINTPGGTINISNRITINNEEVEVNGSINMLYVSEYIATIPTYLLSYIIKDWDLESITESQISNEDADDIYERGRVMLDNSKNNALYVAYTKAEKNITIKDYKNIVIATTIDNGLKIGDEIIEVNNISIDNVNTLKDIINNSSVSDTLNMKIIRDNKEKEIKVNIKEEEGEKVIGVVVITNYEYELDPKIEINFKTSESGSSGGLMMALSIYNAISDKDIIKGRNIAGTGTISMDGTVGEIDGIKYKVMGAVKDKMDLILVPSGNYEEALKVKKEKEYDIDIVSIDTFDDAINYLENNN